MTSLKRVSDLNKFIKSMVLGIQRKSAFKEVLLVIFMSFVWGAKCQEDEPKEITFKDIAPVNYDYLRTPAVNETLVNVQIGVKNLNVRSVDESDMSFTVAVELWQIWIDPRLIYPKWAKEKGYQVLDSSWITKLWSPNLYFPNAVEGKVNSVITPSSFFWLTRESRIVFCCRLVLKLICEMNLVHFPHDDQRCAVKMGSAIYYDSSVKLVWSNVSAINSAETFSSLQQFQIISLEQTTCSLTLGSGNVSCLEAAITLRRRSGYYMINVYIPTVLIVIMSMLTFWIPADAVPARITLGVTSLLTIITKQYQAAMPSVSYIVGLNVWLSCCIAFVFFSLLEFATVIAMGTKKAQSPQHQDLILPMVLLRANGTWATKKSWSNVDEKANFSKRLDYFSRLFFPISFTIFVICYWRYYS